MAILSYIKSSKDSVLKIREFDFKKLFTDIIVYISIVCKETSMQLPTSSSASPINLITNSRN